MDICSKMTVGQYKEFLDLMQTFIVATDLSVYFSNKSLLEKATAQNKFTFDDDKMLKRALEMAMTAADLISSCKPWKKQRSSTNNLYKEFYNQGDEERRHGLQVGHKSFV